jgi:hypothetical protein
MLKNIILSLIIACVFSSFADAHGHHGHPYKYSTWSYYPMYSWGYPYFYGSYYWNTYPQNVYRHTLPNDKYYQNRINGLKAQYESEQLQKNNPKRYVPKQGNLSPSFKHNGKKYDSYSEFKKSDAYYEMKAEAWMRNLTRKAEASIEKKKETEDFKRLKELKELSGKQKLQLPNKRRVEAIMGKDFLK